VIDPEPLSLAVHVTSVPFGIVWRVGLRMV
jgi:hypothetical protein